MSLTLDRATGPGFEEDWERRWTREEFQRAADLGLFGPEERLELVDGKIIRKMTQNPPHAIALNKTGLALTQAFGPDFTVFQQRPIALTTDGQPEPDVLVVPGRPDDYPDHPTQNDALLVVEVSDATLRLDRTRKAALYAEAGMADYWIVNLNDRQLEVYRQPGPTPDDPRRFTYASRDVLTPADTVTPLALSGTAIPVGDLLPRA